MMHPLIYTTPLVLLLLAWVSVALGGAWLLLLPLVTFGLVPVLELLLPPRPDNVSGERWGRLGWLYDALLYGAVPGQVGLVVFLLLRVSSGALSGGEVVASALTVGIACGAFGINVAHELGHRREKGAQWAAQALLLTSLYMHFFIEHNRGHHARVSTPEDPASAPRGMTVYRFWLRSVVGSWRGAWEIEDQRLRRHARPRWSLQHQMTRFVLIEAAAVLAVLAVFGPVALGAWLLSAVAGILLLETVNYIEHYGLSRTRLPSGRYERVQPHHSWNADYPVGRALLFELTRHSDHHAHPGRAYSALRHFDDTPQLPTGYPGMILLSLAPPLWFRIMNPHTDAEQARLQHLRPSTSTSTSASVSAEGGQPLGA